MFLHTFVLAASVLAPATLGTPLARPRNVLGRSAIASSSSSPSVHNDVFSLHGRGIMSSHLGQNTPSDDSVPVASVLAAELASSNSSASNSTAVNLTNPVGILGAGAFAAHSHEDFS